MLTFFVIYGVNPGTLSVFEYHNFIIFTSVAKTYTYDAQDHTRPIIASILPEGYKYAEAPCTTTTMKHPGKNENVVCDTFTVYRVEPNGEGGSKDVDITQDLKDNNCFIINANTS